jgi:hypothetical protein
MTVFGGQLLVLVAKYPSNILQKNISYHDEKF